MLNKTSGISGLGNSTISQIGYQNNITRNNGKNNPLQVNSFNNRTKFTVQEKPVGLVVGEQLYNVFSYLSAKLSPVKKLIFGVHETIISFPSIGVNSEKVELSITGDSKVHEENLTKLPTNGKGTFVHENGATVTGNWKDGEPIGLHKVKLPNGQEYYGDWKIAPNGERILEEIVTPHILPEKPRKLSICLGNYPPDVSKEHCFYNDADEVMKRQLETMG